MDRLRLYERKLELIRALKLRFAREEAQILRLLKQERMRHGGKSRN